MTTPSVEETIQRYENFINDVLREDLRIVEDRLSKTNMQISDLNQQLQTLKAVTNKTIHPNGFKTQVNLGCNFFMEASVPDTSTVLLGIGLNHYLEFPVPEALKYIDVLIKAYEEKAEELKTKAVETKAHIKMMLIGMGELLNESKKKNC